MPIACPHCRELVTADPQTQLPPALCPRCGGDLPEPTQLASGADPAAPAGSRSFASFLQHEPQTAATESLAETETINQATESSDAADVAAADADAPEQQPPVADQDAVPDQATVLAAGAANPADATAPTGIHTSTGTGGTASLAAAALPRFTQKNAASPAQQPARIWQIALLLALGLLLGLQILIADRARLAADESWRPLITRLCGVLNCSVPTWHQPAAFTMLNRNVRPIANLPGALEAQATFRNDAAWPQAWPLLLLSLSDADGRVVGSRHFTPADYLGKDIAQAELAPGQSAQVTFRLREPAAGVVAFSFDFR